MKSNVRIILLFVTPGFISFMLFLTLYWSLLPFHFCLSFSFAFLLFFMRPVQYSTVTYLTAFRSEPLEDLVSIVVFGALSKLNPRLVPYLLFPYLRL